MFYVLSKTLDVLLSPLTWAIVLALASATRRWRWAVWLGPLSGALLCLFSSEWVSNGLFRLLEQSSSSTLQDGVTYDAAILLGGVVQHRQTASWDVVSYNDNIERLLVTFDLLRTGRVREVIISGGAEPGDSVVEAKVLGRQLEDWGVDASRIVVEGESLNTRDNAVQSSRIARERGYRKVLLVTSAFHMPRALDCFRAAALAVDALPVDYKSFDPRRVSPDLLPRADHLRDSTAAVREIAGRLVYRALGKGG